MKTSRPYNTAAQDDARKNEQGGLVLFGKTNRLEDRAKEFLNSSYIPAKRMAADLEVTERLVQMWRSGERRVPEEFYGEIIRVAQEAIGEQQQALNDWIDDVLQQTYGETKRCL